MSGIISKEHRTTSEDFPSQEGNRTTTGVDSTSNPPSGGEPADVQDGDLPPQLHAGKVGYGPNYRMGPSTTDKMAGYKEELMGSIKKDQSLKQHGHDLRTGELKRREEAEDQGGDAFGAPEDKPQQSQTTSNDDQPPKTDRSVYTGGEESKRVGEDSAAMGNP
ncbi:hypothetical protein DL93DRAFT_1659673 [Clavulina sp. PMI_390]|nr:hypothetical protein DL93DRAFT_1659673 [Clavulina sp. PMI_390]